MSVRGILGGMWEYRTAVGLTDTELNTAGRQGWELVAVLPPRPDDIPRLPAPTFYLKRAINTPQTVIHSRI